MYILMYSQMEQFILTLEMTLFTILLEDILLSIKEKIRKSPLREDNKDKKIPVGFYLCISNIAVIIISNLLNIH